MSQTSERIPPPSPPVTAEPPARNRVFVLAAVLIGILVLSAFTGTFPAVAFVYAIVASVMLHETGHYVTAKWAGMKVTEYFFGFGPRLWSVRKGETEYGIKAIPFGGYVKVVGMNNAEKGIDPADEHRTYRQASYPKQVIMAVSGVVFQFILAFLLLLLVWTVVGVPKAGDPTLTIGSISRLKSGPSPATAAGFKVNDRIVSMDGRPVASWDELPTYIRSRPGQPITFVVDRKGQPVTLTATPADTNLEGEKVGFVGIGPVVNTTTEKVDPLTGAGRSASGLARLTWGSVKALGTFFSPGSLADYGDQLTGGEPEGADPDARPVSVVGVTRIANQAGLFDFIGLIVTLNVFVGIFNLVPLLPLDGGHIAVATYERIRSRKGRRCHADVQKMLPVAIMVTAVLVVLMVTTIWMDIVNPITNPLE